MSISPRSANGDETLAVKPRERKAYRRNLQVHIEIPYSKKRPLYFKETKSTTSQKRFKAEVKVETDVDVKVKSKVEEHKIEPTTEDIDMKPVITERKLSKVERMTNNTDIKAMKKQKSFKAEPTLALPPDTISRYLQEISDFAIYPAPLPTKVSRDLVNLHYGTSKWLFLTKICIPSDRSSSLLHNDRHVICATAVKNPYMPQGPGCSGLLFSCRMKMTEESPWSLFSRITLGDWEYIGEYECFRVGTLTPQEFVSQPEKVRQAWVEKILTTERWPAYTEMRARIYLRKQNKEITKDEVKKAAHLLRPHGSKKKGERQDGWEGKLNEVDVLNALVQGDEHISIIAMKCVGYDHHFSQDLLKCLSGEISPPTKSRAPQRKQLKYKSSTPCVT